MCMHNDAILAPADMLQQQLVYIATYTDVHVANSVTLKVSDLSVSFLVRKIELTIDVTLI